MDLGLDITAVKGFLDAEEGERLYHLATEVSGIGPCLEIGSYCGKSTVYLGRACVTSNNQLYAVDHHRGSEEHQQGEQFHDAELFDTQAGLMNSFAEFRRTLEAAGLIEVVVPIVATSAMAARFWNIQLGLVFIDGGHSAEAALTDYRCWVPWIKPGGYLAIHDIFPNPEDGGRAPFDIYTLAIQSGLFEVMSLTKTLGVLRRI
ncbi:MAG: class I SAM-dependent methyltransferase [Pseudomonadales bacterium]|nr:class I SAM-dependent methyltransferase [Pseudomonadales bacterium]